MSWWRDAWGHRGIRSLGLAWFLSVLATLSLGVAGAVYAYGAGGAPLVAYLGVASTVPGAVLTPVLMGMTHRGRADRVLRRTTVLRAVLAAGAVLAEQAGRAPVLVVSLVGLAVALGASFRPTQALLLPWLARTPRELTAANVAATVSENTAALAGPALTGLALPWVAPGGVVVAATVLLAATGAVLLRVGAPERMAAGPGGEGAARELVGEALRGGRALAAVARPAGVVVLAFAQTFLRGALSVLLVVLALETLGLGESAVGWLTAALGAGGLVGAVVSARALRLSRLGRCFVVGVLLWAVGAALLAGAPGLAAALVALAVAGTGNALEDASMFTLLPRQLGTRATAGGLGALELVVLAGVGTGSLAAPLLVAVLDVRATLLVIGGVLALAALGYAAAFTSLDRAVPPPSPDVELLRGLPAFSVLPVVVVEDLAEALKVEHFRPGQAVVAEGGPGDRFRVVREGHAEVTVHGHPRRTLGPGDGFGEIALLRDIPRTASVTATTDLTTLSLAREAFLDALATTSASRTRAESVAAATMADDPEPGG